MKFSVARLKRATERMTRGEYENGQIMQGLVGAWTVA